MWNNLRIPLHRRPSEVFIPKKLLNGLISWLLLTFSPLKDPSNLSFNRRPEVSFPLASFGLSQQVYSDSSFLWKVVWSHRIFSNAHHFHNKYPKRNSSHPLKSGFRHALQIIELLKKICTSDKHYYFPIWAHEKLFWNVWDWYSQMGGWFTYSQKKNMQCRSTCCYILLITVPLLIFSILKVSVPFSTKTVATIQI